MSNEHQCVQADLIANKNFSGAETTSLWEAMMVQFHEHARAEICFAKQLPGISFRVVKARLVVLVLLVTLACDTSI